MCTRQICNLIYMQLLISVCLTVALISLTGVQLVLGGRLSSAADVAIMFFSLTAPFDVICDVLLQKVSCVFQILQLLHHQTTA